MKNIWLVTAIIFSPTFIFCQGAAFDVHTDISPASGTNGISALSQTVSARIPLGKKRASAWSTGITYKNLLTGNNTYVINDLWLHSIGASLSYRKRTSEKTVMSISVQPSIWSDFADISGEDLRFNASIHFANRKSNGGTLGWGIAYSYQFFGNQITPFIDYTFRNSMGRNRKDSTSGTWRIGGALPLRPRIEYVFNRNTAIGFRLEGNFSSFRLSEKLKSQYLFYREWNAGLYLDQKISGKWYFTAGAGYAFTRSLQIFDKDQTVPLSFFGNKIAKKYTPSYDNQSKGMVFRIGIQMRLFPAE